MKFICFILSFFVSILVQGEEIPCVTDLSPEERTSQICHYLNNTFFSYSSRQELERLKPQDDKMIEDLKKVYKCDSVKTPTINDRCYTRGLNRDSSVVPRQKIANYLLCWDLAKKDNRLIDQKMDAQKKYCGGAPAQGGLPAESLDDIFERVYPSQKCKLAPWICPNSNEVPPSNDESTFIGV